MNTPEIRITGSSGYLGTLIKAELEKNGYRVSAIPRSFLYGEVKQLSNEIEGAYAVINLAGVSILRRWTKKNKSLIYESRIKTTSNLVQAIKLLPPEKQPAKFISASAIGIYKSGEVHNDYSTNFDTGFVGKVVKDWEYVLNDIPANIQKNIFRIGLVLGKNAKIIKNLVLPFKLCLGGPIGNGKQAFPYIHEKDLVRAFIWVLKEFDKNETFNLVAPEQISQKEFSRALAKTLNRPAIIPVPAFIIKLFLGEAAFLLLKSPEVVSEKLLHAAFQFQYSNIETALAEILS